MADLRARLSDRDVVAVVLFGSVARGEATEASDIDLLVLPRNARGERRVMAQIRAIEESRAVKFSSVVSRSPRLVDLERQFVESIVRQGIVLAGQMPLLSPWDLDLEPVRLLGLNLAGMDQPSKVRLERVLFGYSTHRRRGTKTYSSSSKGLVSGWGGRRMGRAIVVVPEPAVPELERVLRAHGARRILVPAWIQRP